MTSNILFSLKKNKKHFILLAAFFAFAGFLFFPSGVAAAAMEILINPLLILVREFVVMILSVATTLFGWIIDVNNFNQIIANNGALYAIWQKVRDILNVAFILVLLFSAFSTIFQVEKYNYKKILLNLVIMALLVNFSFPITRFIIDISNVMMYTFVNNLPWGDGAERSLVGIADNSGMAAILKAEITGKSSVLVAQIVFGFILAVTLLAVGVLFIIRMIALSLLIVFSPIAFTGSILPDTSGKASQWWGYLFQYAFFGPVMMFMIYISTMFMKATGESDMQAVFTKLGTEQSIDGTLIGNMAMFSIPIVLLWMGMGVAQSMSIAGASTVMGGAQKFAKWVPNAIGHATGVPGGIKKAADYYGKKGAPGFLGKIPGLRGEEKTEELEARIGGLLTKGRKGWSSAAENTYRKRVAAKQKEFEDERLSESAAKLKLDSNDNVERKAAALYLSKKDKINDSTTFAKAMKALAGDEELQNELKFKTKKDNNIKFILDYNLENGMKIKDESGKEEFIAATNTAKIYAETLDMSAEDLAKQKSLNATIGSDKNLQKHIESIISKPNGAAYANKLFEKLTSKQRDLYADKGFNPEALGKKGQQRTGQPTKTHQQTQQELAQKNDREMKKHFS